jgi:SSS family solute:Na+ symporter
MDLNKLDLAIIALYLVGITLFGLRFRKRHRSLRDYFLAGRDIPWWAIALSIVAAETSTLTIISIPGLAYDTNLTFLQVVMGYIVGRIVICAVLLPHYFRGDLYTAYELIERRFGHGLRSLTAGLFLLTRAAAEGVRVYAVSIVVSIALGTGEVASIAIITVLTLIYTFEGGLAAVIWTDVVQTAIYVGGTLVGLVTILHLVPGGWTAIRAAAASAGKLQVFDFRPNFWLPYTLWAGVIGGTAFITASHGTDQLIVQRLLAARGQKQSAVALLSSGGGDSVSIRAVPDCRRDAVGVLSRAVGALWNRRPNLSHIHCQPNATRDLGVADCRDPGCGNVESERGAEFAFVEHDHGFCSPLAAGD